MRLMFIGEEYLYDLKTNLPNLLKYYKYPDNNWLGEYFGNSPFLETRFDVEEFELDVSQTKPFYTDFENVKRVYSRLKDITDSQASDERLWAGLSLGPFWRYVQYRWDIIERCTKNNIEQHYFFGFPGRRGIIRNSIARLWWIGRLTTDFDREDPFELTQIVCENSDNIMHIIDRNFSNNRDVIFPFLAAISEAKKENLPLNTNSIGDLSKYLNILGGTYILDVLDSNILYNKVLKRAREITEEN
jgi:hypothetical protein